MSLLIKNSIIAVVRLALPGSSILVGLGLLLKVLPALAQVNYVSSQLALDSNFREILHEDMNGDGRVDLVTSAWTRSGGRELLIYYQQMDGRFAQLPQRIEVKTEIIALGFADIRPQPGTEILVLTGTAVFSLSAAIEGYVGNLRPLLEWQLIADVPDLQDVEFFHGVADINGDGYPDLLLPGPEGFAYFAGGPDESFTLVQQFSTVDPQARPAPPNSRRRRLFSNLEINQEQGIALEVAANRPTPFENFVEPWQAQASTDISLFHSETWLPSAVLAQLDDDGRLDLAYLNEDDSGQGRFNILLQGEDGRFPAAPNWQGALDARGSIRLRDVDGDGRTDLLAFRGNGDERSVMFYVNQGGRFDLAQPTQVLRFSGYDVEAELIDIDGRGKPALAVSYYTVPVAGAIRNPKVVRTQLLYGSQGTEGSQVFSRRPASRLDEDFSVSNVRALAGQMSLRFDIDNDGVKDALYITGDGALAAKKINADLSLATEPFWHHVPERSIVGFDVVSLNDDGMADLILRHSNSISLLVSRP
ncbi:MAG: VCBS repeat-containing protein [Pseudomonadales bacterium]|nr:VCBS repeat-containing protein [Pseudomonadales bacterium]